MAGFRREGHIFYYEDTNGTTLPWIGFGNYHAIVTV